MELRVIFIYLFRVFRACEEVINLITLVLVIRYSKDNYHNSFSLIQDLISHPLEYRSYNRSLRRLQ